LLRGEKEGQEQTVVAVVVVVGHVEPWMTVVPRHMTVVGVELLRLLDMAGVSSHGWLELVASTSNLEGALVANTLATWLVRRRSNTHM
jgi:hypothetical protein